MVGKDCKFAGKLYKMLQLIQIKEDGVLLDEIRTLFREYEKELDENLCFQSFEAELKDPLKKYGSPKGILYIAEWNYAVAGCIALMPLQEEGVCEMKRLYVRPQFRKHKIGKAMVDEGCRRTWIHNHEARYIAETATGYYFIQTIWFF